MIKFSCVFIFLALVVNSQESLLDIFKAKSCPQYSGMPNIDAKKVTREANLFSSI